MNLDHIADTACPECGCAVILAMDKMNKHSNGQWNERVKFGCGMRLHYSPNHQRVEVEEGCTRSPSFIAWKEQRTVIALAMVEAAKKAAGVPESIDLGSLARSLRSDLDLYRNVLESPSK